MAPLFLLAALGLSHLLAGLVALDHPFFYEISPTSDQLVRHDIAGWGWVHLMLGVLLLVVAGGDTLARHRGWWRISGVVLAALGALSNFFFLAYHPIWSALTLALAAAAGGVLLVTPADRT